MRTARSECLDWMLILSHQHLVRVLDVFVTHYHRERNHQGLENRLIKQSAMGRREGRIPRRARLGGLLNFTGGPRNNRYGNTRRWAQISDIALFAY